jgi:NAD(P)-dependent dehydrogenase (short-subunit alcohol dehydrogenase family)
MLIEKKVEFKDSLKNRVVLITGAGGGIGFETAKAFAYMGANVIIAEIDKNKGIFAEKSINDIFSNKLVEFYEIDISKETKINKMIKYINKKYGCPDIIFNNAINIKIGALDEISTKLWDLSYAVNLKAPFIFTQKYIPMMKKRNSGIIVFVSSSGAAPYMGAYEVFKTAQVELSNTLAMELENSNVFAYTIGPGLVKTKTAMGAIEVVASKIGMSTEEFYSMNKQHIISAEYAGIGFALSVLKAEAYNGQEIGSIQILMDYDLLENKNVENDTSIINKEVEDIKHYMNKICNTYLQQYDGWKAMNVFERQWIFRDFKKCMALSVEQASEKIININNNVQNGNVKIINEEYIFIEKLNEYWKRQLKYLQGYEKDKIKLEENTKIINEWINDIEKIL